jgi:Uma2 family endonuclease
MSAVKAAREPGMSVDGFLAWERAQPERHELIDGRVYAMVGASLAHGRIVFDLAKALDAAVDPERCIVLLDGAKLRTAAHVFYPDVMVTCEEYDLEGDVVHAPALIAEVLSPSTQSYDRGAKWRHYQQLPSLQTFLLVAQDVVWVQVWRRSGAGWDYASLSAPDDVVAVDHPRCALRVGDLYARLR